MSSSERERSIELFRREECLLLIVSRMTPEMLEYLPEKNLEMVRKGRIVTAVREERLLYHAQRLQANLWEVGCSFVFLKGLALLTDIYQTPGIRPMADVDVLVDPAEATSVLRYLRNRGWKGMREEVVGKIKELDGTLQDPVSYMNIDVHSDIDDNPSLFNIDTAAILASSRKRNVRGYEIYLPCDEDMLIHLCVHGFFRHAFRPWKFLFDLMLFLQLKSNTLDWEAISKKAEKWGVLHVVTKALVVIRTLSPTLDQQLEENTRGFRWKNLSEREVESYLDVLVVFETQQITRLRRLSYLFSPRHFRAGLKALRLAVIHRYSTSGFRGVVSLFFEYAILLVRAGFKGSSQKIFRSMLRR